MGDVFMRPDKKGNPRYTARTRVKGCKPLTKTFGRKTDANDWLKKTEGALIENRDFPEREERKHTVNELFKEYKENGFVDKPDSKKKQSKQLDWWADQIGHLELKKPNSKGYCHSDQQTEKTQKPLWQSYQQQHCEPL